MSSSSQYAAVNENLPSPARAELKDPSPKPTAVKERPQPCPSCESDVCQCN